MAAQALSATAMTIFRPLRTIVGILTAAEDQLSP
jgi:hypothetical protein